MAQVTSDTERHIERLLADLLDLWQNLPRTACEIDNWDRIDQQVFVEEWLLQEQRLGMLAEYVAKDLLTAKQLKRYQELTSILEQNRSLAEQICKR